jgi:hypothetical protein
MILKPSGWRLEEKVTNNAACNLPAMKGCTSSADLKRKKRSREIGMFLPE